MSRFSPITIGVIALACVMSAVALYVVLRPDEEPPAAPAVEVPVAEPPPSLPPSAPQVRGRVPTPLPPPAPTAVRAPASLSSTPAPPLPAPPLPAPPPTDAGVTDGSPGDAATAQAMRRRDLIVASQRQRIIQAADEQVFESLKLPDSTRVAIRQLNAETARARQAQLSGSGGVGGAGAREELVGRADQAERTRREAIERLLGPEGAKQFTAAEFAASRRERRAHRTDFAQEQTADPNAPATVAPTPGTAPPTTTQPQPAPPPPAVPPPAEPPPTPDQIPAPEPTVN